MPNVSVHEARVFNLVCSADELGHSCELPERIIEWPDGTVIAEYKRPELGVDEEAGDGEPRTERYESWDDLCDQLDGASEDWWEEGGISDE